MRIELCEADRRRLERLVANGNTAKKHVGRARIVLLTAAGLRNAEIARQSRTSLPTVRRWRKRFQAVGVDGLLKDATRAPGTPALPPTTVERVVALMLRELSDEATPSGLFPTVLSVQDIVLACLILWTASRGGLAWRSLSSASNM